MIQEYVLAGAFIAVLVLGWLWVKHWGPARGRPLASGVWALLLLIAIGAIFGAGGAALADLVAQALGISSFWLVSLGAAVAVAFHLRRRRGGPNS